MVADNESGFDREFVCGEFHRLAGNIFFDAIHFEEHCSWLDDGDIVINRAFTATHPDFIPFKGNWFIREDPNPDFSTPGNKASHRSTSRFDLTSGHPSGFQRLQAETTKRDVEFIGGFATDATAVPFAMFNFLGGQHRLAGFSSNVFENFAFVDPNLYTDFSVGSVRFATSVIDIRAKSLERETALGQHFRAGDFGTV